MMKLRELTALELGAAIKRGEISVKEAAQAALDAVAAQNPGLNPALLSGAVETYMPELAPDFVQVRRLEMLDGEGRRFR